MAPQKVITVFGATGAQGGSVASIFLSDTKLKASWAVRAVTRDLSKPSAQRLVSQGADVVYGDLSNKESIAKATDGSYAVFGVTNYWESMDASVEIQQGKNLADAVKDVGVKHFIWSSLLNVKELSGGKLSNVYHFDSKAEVERYIRTMGIPATYFLAGLYMTGIPGEMFTAHPPDNTCTFALPVASSAIIPMYHPGDTGKYVKAIVLNANELLGHRVLGATAYMTAQEVVEGFAKVFPEAGKTAKYFQVPEAMFTSLMTSKGLPDFAILELYENIQLLEEFGYFGGASLDESHRFLEDPLTTWEEYAKGASGFKGLN
ncbi:hypothetical protein O1611_g975 [Lasiodiplodia mahajangana]|uniref:Uncharacterized protein n=1 Tax=Lasiodiplodia mahajangana TaxID=1108764 RepID=A0ACC2JYS3_9PEZI|nr:hypothetical protein O1611_g975 [Lasiodiplodia mahajangana]